MIRVVIRIAISAAVLTAVSAAVAQTKPSQVAQGKDQRATRGASKSQPPQPPQITRKRASPSQTSARQTSKSPAEAGAVIFVDPVTRQIREPSADEIDVLTQSRPQGSQPVAPIPPTEIRGPGGAVGILLGEDSQSYMVVTKTPDGKLVTDEVATKEAAEVRVQTSGATTSRREK